MLGSQWMKVVDLKRKTPVSPGDHGGFEVYQAPWNFTETVRR